MWELRWILAGLGVALIAALYIWGRMGRRASALFSGAARAAGTAHSGGEAAGEAATGEGAGTEAPASSPKEKPKRRRPEKVIALRLVPRDQEIRTESAVLALREAGLRLGRYGIFHLQPDRESEEPAFSVASLVEPGAFELGNLQESTIPGMSIFMVLPGYHDPVTSFDQMVQISRALAHALDAELFDDRGSSWSIQRERYVREELIEYRHQIGRAAQ